MLPACLHGEFTYGPEKHGNESARGRDVRSRGIFQGEDLQAQSSLWFFKRLKMVSPQRRGKSLLAV